MAVPRTNAGTDDNWRSTLMGVSSVDGRAPTPLEVNPATGAVLTETTGGSGSLQDTTTVGTLSALSAALALVVQPGQTSWSVQATGAFVATFQTQVTLNGTDWIGVNSRQSGTGALKNTFTKTGIFRGSAGGCAQFRVICTSYTSGSAVITIRLGSGVGAIFSNSTVLVQSSVQYYTSTAGGSSTFGASSGPVATGTGGGNIALFRNPTGSTTDAYIQSLNLGTDVVGRIDRYFSPVVTSVTTPVTCMNRAGQSVVNQAQLYSATGPQFVTSANGSLAKNSYVAAMNTERSLEDGSIIVRPGQDLLFRFTPPALTASNPSIEIVWWETGTLT